MIVIFFLIPLSIVIAVGFLGAFIWAVRSGQYEDTCTPAMRVLLEDKSVAEPPGQQKTGVEQYSCGRQTPEKFKICK